MTEENGRDLFTPREWPVNSPRSDPVSHMNARMILCDERRSRDLPSVPVSAHGNALALTVPGNVANIDANAVHLA